jgi:hypothetical protein
MDIVIRPVNFVPGLKYDAFIAAVGYEERARYVAKEVRPSAQRLEAAGFPDQQSLNYSRNLDWYRSAKYRVETPPDEQFAQWISGIVRTVSETNGLEPTTVCVDISSLSRFRIAVVVDELRRLGSERPIIADFVYALAQFSSPSVTEAPNTHVGPVIPEFAGWSCSPDEPSSVILGLGYEQDKALGAVEHVQPGDVWVFSPASSIPQYTAALDEANASLLSGIPASNRFVYDVMRPFDCFLELESLVSRCLQSSSTIVFPFGPKVFALVALLTGCLYPDLAIWRVSAGSGEEPADRTPNGEICALRAVFMPDVSNQAILDQKLLAPRSLKEQG